MVRIIYLRVDVFRIIIHRKLKFGGDIWGGGVGGGGFVPYYTPEGGMCSVFFS